MADLLYIANGALDLVGQGNITSIDDSTPAAKKAKLHIYAAIKEVLALGKFKSAKGSAKLALLTAAPLFGWDYAYQLPSDYVRMVSFNDYDPDNWIKAVYDIQGQVLLTDETFADVVYVKDLGAPGNDLSVASAPLVELMVVKLAQKLAWPMQQSRGLKESLQQEFILKRRAALAADAQETRNVLVNPSSESTWLRARFSSTNG